MHQVREYYVRKRVTEPNEAHQVYQGESGRRHLEAARESASRERTATTQYIVRCIDLPSGFARGILSQEPDVSNIRNATIDVQVPDDGMELVWSRTNQKFVLLEWNHTEVMNIEMIPAESVKTEFDFIF